jgi:hypothetical protein
MGNFYTHAPSGYEDSELSLGFGARLRACFNVSKLVGLCIDPTLLFSQQLSNAYTYTDSILINQPRSWVASLGAGLGIEYAL